MLNKSKSLACCGFCPHALDWSSSSILHLETSLLQYSCLENPMDRGVWWVGHSPWGRRVWHGDGERVHTPHTSIYKRVFWSSSCGPAHTPCKNLQTSVLKQLLWPQYTHWWTGTGGPPARTAAPYNHERVRSKCLRRIWPALDPWRWRGPLPSDRGFSHSASGAAPGQRWSGWRRRSWAEKPARTTPFWTIQACCQVQVMPRGPQQHRGSSASSGHWVIPCSRAGSPQHTRSGVQGCLPVLPQHLRPQPQFTATTWEVSTETSSPDCRVEECVTKEVTLYLPPD